MIASMLIIVKNKNKIKNEFRLPGGEYSRKLIVRNVSIDTIKVCFDLDLIGIYFK